VRKNREENINRKDDIQELLGHIPGRLTRWGNIIIFAIMILIFMGSWVIKYPEIVYSKVKITSSQPPVDVLAKTNAKIEKLFIKDKQQVKKGDILANLQSHAVFNDVIYLKNIVDSILLQNINLESIPDITVSKSLLLGDIQVYYSDFITTYDKFKGFTDLNYHERLIYSLNQQIEDYQAEIQQQQQQLKLLKDELSIAERQHERNKMLFEKEIISKAVLERSESSLIEKKLLLEQANTQISNIRLRISEIEQRKLDLALTGKDNKNQFLSDFKSALLNLKNEIEKWTQKYVLISPIDGIVNISVYRTENLDVIEGATVFSIVPLSNHYLTGKLVIPMSGAGKVKEGQNVNIKFESYPFMEYGIVKGKIKSISLVPENNFFIAEIDLPKGLLTTYNKQLILKQEMTGIAEIITDDLSLLSRLFIPIKSLLKERV